MAARVTGPYIPRLLLRQDGTAQPRLLAETDIAALDGNIVILGDPGMGKTRLTESLQQQLRAVRVTAGTFQRDEGVSRYTIARDGRLIIDGLDEIVATRGASAIDEVLKKLSRIGYPRFVLSCRAADWQGATNRHRIVQDYGMPLHALQLQPFSDVQALQFLAGQDPGIDAAAVLEDLARRDLEALYRNPLTLQLTAELIQQGQGLPQSRSDLFERACLLLVREENAAHQRSVHAMCAAEDLLIAAGAIFAHLILSGLQGVADRPFSGTPGSFLHQSQLTEVPDAPFTEPALKTRLFQGMAEGLFVPFHRMIAEFLGARWLAMRITRGLSKRRLHQAFVTAHGVPATLRGLHAWLGHFSAELAADCIRADAYGTLRYGEPSRLPLPHARLLLSSLASLADEDPYFREDDWSSRTVGWLTRPELKDPILQLLRTASRHVDLSKTVLEAIAGSPLANELKPELLQIVEDEAAARTERVSAARALIDSRTEVAWPSLVAGLCDRGTHANCAIALEIMRHLESTRFTGAQIANAFLAFMNACKDEEPRYAYVRDYYGIFDSGPAKWLSASQCAEVLNALVDQVPVTSESYWNLMTPLADLTQDLIVTAVREHPTATQLWCWVQFLHGGAPSSMETRRVLREYLVRHETLRRETQKVALAALADVDDGSNVGQLAREYEHLAFGPDDALALLEEIAAKDPLTDYDRDLWISLVVHLRIERERDEELQVLARRAIAKHPCLAGEWYDFQVPELGPSKLFEEEGAALLKAREAICAGDSLQDLYDIAQVYLGTYYPVLSQTPLERVEGRWGQEVRDVAVSGLDAFLERPDLPCARDIVEQSLAGEERRQALVLIAAITDRIRQNRPASDIPATVLIAGAAAAAVSRHRHFGFPFADQPFWQYVSPAIFSTREVTTRFLTDVLWPYLKADFKPIPSLTYLHNDAQLMAVAAPLMLGWLEEFPDMRTETQSRLLALSAAFANREPFRILIRKQLAVLESVDAPRRGNWIAAALLVDFAECMPRVLDWCEADRDLILPLTRIVGDPARADTSVPKELSLPQLAFIVRVFGPQWPYIPSWDTPGEATQVSSFIQACIEGIGTDASEEAAATLGTLAQDPRLRAWGKQIRHVRSRHLRGRRDGEYVPPSLEDLKQILAGRLPGSVDDLKALLLDGLAGLEEYIRHSDTCCWESFWENDRPKPENTCRDRLIDLLRPRIAPEIMILPEPLMPGRTRADLVAIYRQMGVPVEIKGQWHADVWDATIVQLIDRYAHDWRADGRGIYLVLWFGEAAGRNLRKHPQALPPPRTPFALREMLVERLPPDAGGRIDIVVLDLSKPHVA